MGHRDHQANYSWFTGINDTMVALSAETGEKLWEAPHPLSGYASSKDLYAINGIVWYGETTSGHAKGTFTGRDIKTGRLVKKFDPGVKTYWFHHRCYRGKATENFILISRTGTEFVDPKAGHWDINHRVRGACLYGVMPANGLLYAPQHPCACFPEAKLTGFNALAPAGQGPRIPKDAASKERLVKGPAYGHRAVEVELKGKWPTYRGDNRRSGRASCEIPAELKPNWQTAIGGKISSPVIAGGKIFVAQIDKHTLVALDAESGKPSWKFTAGGRIDSPPTFYRGRVFFGSAGGDVYSLRASDGTLA